MMKVGVPKKSLKRFRGKQGYKVFESSVALEKDDTIYSMKCTVYHREITLFSDHKNVFLSSVTTT